MLGKNTYCQIFETMIHHTKFLFALKPSISFLTSLLSLTITKSGVYGVLVVVGIATIFFTVIDGISNIHIVYIKSISDSGWLWVSLIGLHNFTGCKHILQRSYLNSTICAPYSKWSYFHFRLQGLVNPLWGDN